MKTRFLFVFILVLIPVLLLSACLPQASTGSNTSDDGSVASAVPSDVKPSDAPSEDAPPVEESPGAAPDAPVDCAWTLYVDQTIPKVEDGLTVNYQLMIVAQKDGGKDVYGTYTGVAYVGVNFDASQMSNSVMQVLGGFNVNAYTYDLTFDVVAYDEETYSAYGLKPDDVPLAQLVIHESMALLSPSMTGTGTFDTSLTGVQGEQGGYSDSAQSTTVIPMRILINSGKVSVYVPSMGLSDSFKGMVTGVPLSSGSTDDDMITQAAEQIQAFMDQAAEAEAAAGDSMGDLIGQLIPN